MEKKERGSGEREGKGANETRTEDKPANPLRMRAGGCLG